MVNPRFQGTKRTSLVTLAAAVLAALTCPAVAAPPVPGQGGGRLLGYIQDTRGLPVSGALISVFGKGLRGGILTYSDKTGRVVVPSVPAGAYTLRALSGVEGAAAMQRVTVLPNQDSVFALSLHAVLEDPDSISQSTDDEAASQPARRLRWLVRHKPRSILEDEDYRIPEAQDLDRVRVASGGLLSEALPWLPEMQGSVEWATPRVIGSETSASDSLGTNVGALKLRGRIGDAAEWSLGGLLAESGSASWRMAAEFIVEPGDGHRIETGAGYGDSMLRTATAGGPIDDGSTGAVFVIDRFQRGPVEVSLGARYSYISFLNDGNHVSPQASLTAQAGENTKFRLGYSSQAVTPGGDLLALSTLSVTPVATEINIDPTLRVERVGHLEFAGIRSIGPLELTGFAFTESITDPLLNAYESGRRPVLRVSNGVDAACRGVGLTLARHFGRVADGSVTYSYGRQRGHDALLTGGRARFHDVVARVETAINSTDTRFSGMYRINALGGPGDGPGRSLSTRFDFQLSQGLPFLGSLTRADWDLLVAYRNLLYEAAEGGFLDEIVVKNPPKRVVGGVSVRF